MARRVSAKTRVKLSQAAKRRRRGTKGTSLAGRFLAGSGAAGHPTVPRAVAGRSGHYDKNFTTDDARRMSKANADGKKKKIEVEHGDPAGGARRSVRSDQRTLAERGSMARDTAMRRTIAMSSDPRNREAMVFRLAKAELEEGLGRTKGGKGRYKLTQEELEIAGLTASPVTSRVADRQEIKRALKDKHWKEKGVHARGRSVSGTPKDYLTPSEFRKQLPPSQRAAIEQARYDANSWMYKGLAVNEGSAVPGGWMTAGARRREQEYYRKMQDGYSHDEAVAHVLTENRGRKPRAENESTARSRQAQNLLERRGEATGMRSKYGPTYDARGPMKASIETPSVMSFAELKRKLPGLDEGQYVALQEAQRRTIFDDVQKNTRWNHETQAAKFMGATADDKDYSNRVVFFTTSLGAPTVSVPSDSLVGQYIVKRRKNMMIKDGLARPKELRGEFPQAVRDMHIIEAGTGVSVGARGDAGLFARGGWRAGSKRSKNYGKAKPIGASIMTDSQGYPMYDADGNIRYSEGLTRRYDYQKNAGGFRVFMG